MKKKPLINNKKSHLPLKYSTHLTISNIKSKTRKLIMTSILLIVAITMMGLSITFADFDISYLMKKSISRNNIESLLIYEGKYDDNLKRSDPTYAYSYSDKFYDGFKEKFPDLDLYKIYGGSFVGYKDESSVKTVVPTDCKGIVDIKTIDDLYKLGFNGLTAGKMPEATTDKRYTEILMTDVLFLLNLMDPSSVMMQWMFDKNFMGQFKIRLFENLQLFTWEEIKTIKNYFSSLEIYENIDYSKNVEFFKVIIKIFPIFADFFVNYSGSGDYFYISDFFVNYSGSGDYFYISDSISAKIVGIIKTENFEKYLSLSSKILDGSINKNSYSTLENGEELQFLMKDIETLMVYVFTDTNYFLENNSVNHVNFGESTIKTETGVFDINLNSSKPYRYFVNIKYDLELATKKNILKLRNGYKFAEEEFIAPIRDENGNNRTTLINNDVILNKEKFLSFFGNDAYDNFEIRNDDFFVELDLKNNKGEYLKR